MKEQIIKLLSNTLLNSSLAISAWLGGSTATGREDQLSDTDLVIIGLRPDEIFKLIEETLKSYAAIEKKWMVEDISRYYQCFYTIDGSSETYYIDIVIFENQSPEYYREYFNPYRHGTPHIIFDKTNILKEASRVPKFETSLEVNWDNFLGKFEVLFRTFLKEYMRGKYIDAHAFYMKLVTIWVQYERLRYCPQKHDFNFRYLYIDLPQENAQFIEELLKVSDLETMKKYAYTLKEKLTNHQGNKA